MLIRVYWSTWIAFALSALLLFVTGNLTPPSVVVLGFFAFGLTFTGMMNVLPIMVAHPTAAEPVKAEPFAIRPGREVQSRVFVSRNALASVNHR